MKSFEKYLRIFTKKNNYKTVSDYSNFSSTLKLNYCSAVFFFHCSTTILFDCLMSHQKFQFLTVYIEQFKDYDFNETKVEDKERYIYIYKHLTDSALIFHSVKSPIFVFFFDCLFCY